MTTTLKNMPAFSCVCTEAGFPPGIHIPTEYDDFDKDGNALGESRDGCVFIDRCDACALFRSAEHAAQFLSVVVGKPVQRVYYDTDYRYYRVAFDMTIAEALSINIHHGMKQADQCLACIAEKPRP